MRLYPEWAVIAALVAWFTTLSVLAAWISARRDRVLQAAQDQAIRIGNGQPIGPEDRADW